MKYKVCKKVIKTLNEAQKIAQIGSWDWDVIHDRVIWTDEMYRILDLEPNSIPPRRGLYTEYILPEHKEKVTLALKKALESKCHFDIEFEIITAAGRHKYIKSQASYVVNNKGRTSLLIGTMQDITERKCAELALKHHTDFEHAILLLTQSFINLPINQLEQSVSEALGVVGQYCSADRVTIFRYDWNAETVNHLYEWDKEPQYYAGDKVKKVPFALMTDILESHKNGEVYHYVKNRNADIPFDGITEKSGCESGIVFPLYRKGKLYGTLGLASVENLFDYAYSQTLVRVFSEMISSVLQRLDTEKVNNQLVWEVEALRTIHKLDASFIKSNDLKALYSLILDSAISLTDAQKGCIQLYDQDTQVLKLSYSYNLHENIAGIYGNIPIKDSIWKSANTDSGRIIVDNFSQNEQLRDTPIFKYFVEQGIRRAQSTPLISSSGSFVGILNTYYEEERVFLERELNMLDMLSHMAADGIEWRTMEMALDQSRQRALDLVEELKKNDRNKNDFLNALSHELRNPLASIVSGLSMIDMIDDNPKTRLARDIVKRQTQQLCKLVDDLLDLTRITNNKIQLKKEKVDLNRITEAVVNDYRVFFNEKGVGLDTSINMSTPAVIDADPVRISQAIGNLLNNALKFTQAGGKTVLSIYCINKTAFVSIKDNGIGVEADFLPELFEPFKQADTNLSNNNSGLGLGLSIVKGIVGYHGGTVSAFSSGLGKGAEFIIKLPRINSAGGERPSNDSTDILSPNAQKVLLIDDNKDLVEIIRSLLEMSGYEVETAYTGLDGVEKAQSYCPDIILCDIGLPDMNGYDVAKNIRLSKKMGKAYLIALSGYAQAEDFKRSVEAGFDHHIVKPMDFENFIKILKSIDKL